MHVILEVESGTAAGRKRFLRAGETLEVGRSGLLDFAFENDDRMSGRHFRIVATRDSCHIEDLNSTNGTEVNGQKINRVPLQNNDHVTAGNTRFLVHVEGAANATVVVNNTQTGTKTEIPVSASYTTELCKSGLRLYKGSAEEFAPGVLARRFNEHFQQVLILTRETISPELREQVGEHDYLFDWLPEETREAGSPWMMTDAKAAAGAKVVEQTWGKDGLVCVYSDKDEALPLDQLKRCAGTFVRPSVLRPQLSETVAEIAEDMMLEIELVLVEDAKPESWLLFTTRELDSLLTQMGLKKVQVEEKH